MGIREDVRHRVLRRDEDVPWSTQAGLRRLQGFSYETSQEIPEVHLRPYISNVELAHSQSHGVDREAYGTLLIYLLNRSLC